MFSSGNYHWFEVPAVGAVGSDAACLFSVSGTMQGCHGMKAHCQIHAAYDRHMHPSVPFNSMTLHASPHVLPAGSMFSLDDLKAGNRASAGISAAQHKLAWLSKALYVG